MTERKYPLHVTLRDGRKAVVLGENPFSSVCPLIGCREHSYGSTEWTEDGMTKLDGSTHPMDIIAGLDTPAPSPKTIKVQALVGVPADGEYSVLGWEGADQPTLVADIADRFSMTQILRYTLIEAEVPLPDDAVETVQGKVVSHD